MNKENVVIWNKKNSIYIRIKKMFISRFPALVHKNFRYFLSGQCISLMGTWIQRTAQQWVVYEITKSAFILGLVGVFQFTPMLLFSLFAGVFVDRFPKKKMLIVTQVLQMIQAFVLAALIWSGNAKYWYILILAGFLGLVQTFDMPIRQSFFIELVGKESLVSAIGLNSTVVNACRIAGPAFAAVFLSYFGSAICFFVNGLSFIAVIIGLLNIKAYSVNIRQKEKNIIYDIKDGLKYVFSSRVLFNAVISMLIVGTIAMNSDVLIPVFAKEVLKQQATGYSFMFSSMGIGSLLGSLIFASSKKGQFGKQMLFKSSIMLAIFSVTTGFSHNYYLSLLNVAGIGFFSMIFMTTVNSTIQLNSSDEYRGRAMSLYTLFLSGSTPIGNLLTGTITQKFGADICFIFNGILTGALILILIINNIKIKNVKSI